MCGFLLGEAAGSAGPFLDVHLRERLGAGAGGRRGEATGG
jgi:hypothetical protein